MGTDQSLTAPSEEAVRKRVILPERMSASAFMFWILLAMFSFPDSASSSSDSWIALALKEALTLSYLLFELDP